jgi:hypothetical protein
MKCQKFENGRPVGGPFDMNKNGHTNPGDPNSPSAGERNPRLGPIPEGDYNLEPKPQSQYEAGDSFKVGTPSVTTPGQAPGVIIPTNGAPRRSNVRVHGEGDGTKPDSDGCPTCEDPRGIKDLMDRNKGKTKFRIRDVDCDCLAPDAPTSP